MWKTTLLGFTKHSFQLYSQSFLFFVILVGLGSNSAMLNVKNNARNLKLQKKDKMLLWNSSKRTKWLNLVGLLIFYNHFWLKSTYIWFKSNSLIKSRPSLSNFVAAIKNPGRICLRFWLKSKTIRKFFEILVQVD